MLPSAYCHLSSLVNGKNFGVILNTLIFSTTNILTISKSFWLSLQTITRMSCISSPLYHHRRPGDHPLP